MTLAKNLWKVDAEQCLRRIAPNVQPVRLKGEETDPLLRLLAVH